MGSRGPMRSKERLHLEADLPVIEERLRREPLTYEQLAREYGLSIQAVKKAISCSDFGARLAAARRERKLSARMERQREKAAPQRLRAENKEKRIAKLREALARGETMAAVARELGMNKGNLSRLAKEAGLSLKELWGGPRKAKVRPKPSD